MKTELIQPTPTETPATKFPVLARHKIHGYVVLFNTENTGMVLVEASGYFAAGYWDDDWTSINYRGPQGSPWEILPAGTKLVITQ